MQTRDLPLVLDLDGTLIRTDMLVEMAMGYLRHNPFRLFWLILWLCRGRAALKRQLSERVSIDASSLPVNEAVADYAASESARGRRVCLATASDALAVRGIVERFSFISDVIASDGVTNMKGAAKADQLCARYPDGFVYAGNEAADLKIWSRARGAILVGVPARVARRAAAMVPVEMTVPRTSRLRALIKAWRLHQWAKNVLVFVPLILSGRLYLSVPLFDTCVAFIAMGMVASSTYLLNDLWDVASDRRHWTKQRRPLASGALPLTWGAVCAPLGIAAGFFTAAVGGVDVAGVMGLYLIGSLAYSYWLKRVPVLDVFMLASLFTLRIGVGVVACDAPPSAWLFVFSMFIFGSLSFAKRYTELARGLERSQTALHGRGYREADLPLLVSMGVASGLAAVIIMILYVINDAFAQSFYGNVTWLWGFPIVLFLFISRIWLVCLRGDLHDDPVVFALKDKWSLYLGAVLFICFMWAWAGVAWL